MRPLRIVLGVLVVTGLLSVPRRGVSAEASAPPAPLAWPEATATARPWAYWWWPGSAVDPANLARQMQQYQEAGMGGVHVIPIYGAKGYEHRYIEYLSPKWMEMLACAITEAQRRGMGVDMTTGTGWCFGGPNVPQERCTRRARFKIYEVAAGQGLKEKLDARWLQALVAVGPDGTRIDLTDRVTEAGAVAWKPDEEGWKVYALSAPPTGQRVKRAAPGGEGFMLNPFSGDVIRDYLVRFTKAFDAYQGPMPRAMYHDSFEYSVDWSPELLAEFARRRGYRLEDELPALFGQAEEERVARVKADYRETVSDMLVEDFLPTWVEWCHQRGILTRNQAHGSPGNLLDLYAAADIPETEMFRHDREVLVAKFASSAAHTQGRRLVACETGTWLAEHFTETLADLKHLVDELFVSGVNHVVYHGTCYSPDDAPWPGWLFYASTEMNPRNAIWRDVPTLNAYIARCQSVFQTSRPDHEILLYWPIHDLWHDPRGTAQPLTVHRRDWLLGQPLGHTARWLWDRGFTFDYVSDRQLAGAAAKGGRIEVPGGHYRAVVVPPCRHMPVPTLRRLFDLAAAGATVIFEEHLPQDVPGLARLDQRREQRQGLLSPILLSEAGKKLQQAKVGQGRVLVGELDTALRQAGIDRETLVDYPGTCFLRRVTDSAHLYFITNQGEQPLEDWITLARPGATALLMDPMSGRVGVAAVRPDGDGKTRVYLQLQPGESIILRMLAAEVDGPAWPYLRPVGSPVEITGNWKVEFLEGGPELPKGFETTRLASWTELGDAEAQRFAGTALYTLRFDAPGAGQRYVLDLGKVCQSARVRLNGRPVATLIAPPFAVRVDDLKAQDNLLEVEVTNVSANRIRDLDRRKVPWKIFHDINFVNLDYRPFDASNWPLYDSGLLGPITLRPVEVVAEPAEPVERK